MKIIRFKWAYDCFTEKLGKFNFSTSGIVVTYSKILNIILNVGGDIFFKHLKEKILFQQWNIQNILLQA